MAVDLEQDAASAYVSLTRRMDAAGWNLSIERLYRNGHNQRGLVVSVHPAGWLIAARRERGGVVTENRIQVPQPRLDQDTSAVMLRAARWLARECRLVSHEEGTV
jgi:hypothetical protein